MAGEQGKAVFAGGAVVTAAVLATLLMTRKAEAQPGTPGNQPVTLDDASMQALLGLLQRSEFMNADLDSVVNLLTNLNGGINQLASVLSQLLGGGGEMINPNAIVSFRVDCPAAFTAYQLPSKIIPYGKEFAIKALPTNAGIIYVGNSPAAAVNPNDGYPLIANEAIMYKIHDTKVIWISATTAGDSVTCTAEQEV